MPVQRKTFGAQDIRHEAPIEFDIIDDIGVNQGTFHCMRKPRLDVIQAMIAAVTIDRQTGNRIHNINVLRQVIEGCLVKERYDPEREAWVPTDDRLRFFELMDSDRVRIEVDTLGEIVIWLTEQIVDSPTGGRSPSSGGPHQPGNGSTDASTWQPAAPST